MPQTEKKPSASKTKPPVQGREGRSSPILLNPCRGVKTGCPNALIPPAELANSFQEMLEREDMAGRLAERLGPSPPHHKKLKLSLAACPNSCSQPQIADLALVARVRPGLARPDDCTACGACEQACPDRAISLSENGPQFDRRACLGCLACQNACPEGAIEVSRPEFLLLAGGRLGRRPRLARRQAVAPDPAEALQTMADWLREYLSQPGPLPRFADWWAARETPGQ